MTTDQGSHYRGVPTTRPELVGTFGMVATNHWAAAQAGMGMMEKGGNAFDAAAASAFVLQVIFPHLCGPAGEVPILFSSKGGPVQALAGQGPAPQGATLEVYRRLGFNIMPGTGLMAATVPAAFDSWMLLLRDYGQLPLETVLEPAIGYADQGHRIVGGVAAAIASMADIFREEWQSSAEAYLVGGAAPKAGSLYHLKQLAGVYQRILSEAGTGGSREQIIDRARDVWRNGFVAEAIDQFCRTEKVLDNSGERHGGVLTGDDIAAFEAHYETPLTYDYCGTTVAKCGPWSQAPVMLQQLALLKGFDIAAMDPMGVDFVHTTVECAKLAFADREKFYGDPDFAEVPMDVLLSDDYNDARRKLVGTDASLELRAGDVLGFGADFVLSGSGEGISGMGGAGEPGAVIDDNVGGDTVHIDAVDRFGNMVSATPSGAWLQSSPVVPGLGFPLGTRAQMFWLDDTHPNGLAPGKRPRTTLSPSMALKDGKPWLSFGTPGGDFQDQWPLTMFLRHVHHGLNLQEAIDLPLFDTLHFPNSFWPRDAYPGHLGLEGGFAPDVVKELRRRGHLVEESPPWSVGRVSAAAIEGPWLKAAATSRFMQTYAVGR
ncbi:MAG: gamma-glutamyltransferase family protein [Alphaproteobacteria bacterium]|jgi:gamma-glutamyltranspeptidase/glutathione hydrolase